MGIAVYTIAHDSTPFPDHEADGSHWHTIPDSVYALIAFRIRESEDDYPQLRRMGIDRTVEYVGETELEQLILETERIPGSEPDLKSTMGKLHGAAVTAFSADLIVSCRSSDDPPAK